MESDKQNVENVCWSNKKNPFLYVILYLMQLASITVEYRFDEIIL